jgi:polygalacturonase
LKAANTDGIDIESCSRVLVEDCQIKTSDDIVCIKAGRNEDAWEHMPPCEDVLVRRLDAEGFCGGLTVGSETSAGIRRIYFEDCAVKGAQWGIRIKTRLARGSTVEELFYRNITLRSCSRGGIEATLCYSDSFEDLLYSDADYQDPARVALRDARGSTVRDLFFEKIDCEGAPVGIQLFGEEAHPIEKVRLADCRFSCERAANMKNVRDLCFEDVCF